MTLIQPHDLDGVAALFAAKNTALCKTKGEMDTAFVKRIVCAYLNAHADLEAIAHAMNTPPKRRKPSK